MPSSPKGSQEFDSTPALIFLRADENPILKEVFQLFGDTQGVRPLCVDTVEETVQIAERSDRAIFVCILSKPSHLKEFAQIASPLRERIRMGTIDIALMNQLAHPNVHKVLKSLGCRELLHPSIKAKPLKIRLQKQLGFLNHFSRQSAATSSVKVPLKVEPSHSRAGQAGIPAHGGEVIEVDALPLLDDCWLTHPKAARRVQGMWMITLIGPGRTAGRWIKAGSNESWEWKPHHPSHDLFVKNGNWVFSGRQPELTDMQWTMIGQSPNLRYFPHDNSPAIHRFKFDEDGNLLLPKNSSFAEAKVPLFKASFEFSILLKKDPEKKVADFVDYYEKNKGKFTPDYKVEVDPNRGRELEIELERPDPGKLLEITQNRAGLGRELEYRDSKPDDKSGGPADAMAEAPLGDFLKKGFGTKAAIDPKRLDYLQKIDKKLRPKNGLFVPVENIADRDSYLEESLQENGVVTIWTPQQAFRKSSKVISDSKEGRSLLIAYPEGFDRSSLLNAFSDMNADRIYLNINLMRSSLFFKLDVPKLDLLDEGLRVQRPDVIYEVQRRNYFRLRFSDERPFYVRIGVNEGNAEEDAKRIFSAIDLSAGGLGIQLHENAKRKFNVGDTLPNLSFTIYGREIRCSGQVRWKRGDTFGIQFLAIDPEVFDGIRLYVMEESYEYFKETLIPV